MLFTMAEFGESNYRKQREDQSGDQSVGWLFGRNIYSEVVWEFKDVKGIIHEMIQQAS